MKRFSAQYALALLFSVLVVIPASAAPAAKRNVPTNITADGMEYSADAQIVIFQGNVHVIRPDFELWSKKLTVYLKKNGKNDGGASGGAAAGMQAGDLDYLVAEGNVRMKSEDKQGECEKATYYIETDKVVMEGSPKLWNKENTIEGRVITHFVEKSYSRVDGSVNATFQTPDNSR